MPSPVSAERRRHPRLVCCGAGQYRNLSKPNESYSGCITQDLSVGGIRFQVPLPLERNARLIFQLTAPGIAGTIRTVAQVVWSSKHPHADRYDVGARFVEISPEDRRSVAQYIERGVHLDPSAG